jgi:glycosyltransferase involved in cell wall biosynthesis
MVQVSRSQLCRRVGLLGTYPPRRCGIAAYTADLHESLLNACAGRIDVRAVAITDTPEGYEYPQRVVGEAWDDDPASFRTAARLLALEGVDVVCVQHEFGIFGEQAGRNVIDFLRAVRPPVVTTLHTVLEHPDPSQAEIMREIIAHSDRLVAIGRHAARLLQAVYQVPAARIDHIPHGIPDLPFADSSFYKDRFGVQGKHTLLTFGLLGPGKGIEHVIRALPGIVERHPDVVYIVLGATHPVLLRREGDAYRDSLESLADRLGVREHVIFHNRYVPNEELMDYLCAADIYVTAYSNLSQVSSGTLAYALGAGKALVSTPFLHAQELLSDDRGIFTPVGEPGAIADAVNWLLDHPVERDAMRKRAYLHARRMIWCNVARMYARSFRRACRDRARSPRTLRARGPGVTASVERAAAAGEFVLPPVDLAHVRRMTDDTGMLQHARACLPDHSHGYCTDDNARALLLMAWLWRDEPDAQQRLELIIRYLAFLQFAFSEQNGRFRNFLAYAPRTWLEEAGSDDSHGRALRALGATVNVALPSAIRNRAAALFRQGLPAVRSLGGPRSIAFTLLGLHAYLQSFRGDRVAGATCRWAAERLLELHTQCSTTDWVWLEESLTYSNAVIPQAMLVAGQTLKRQEMIDCGLAALGWLVEQQVINGRFVPIGNRGFAIREGHRARFDQQPIEACATVGATLTAWHITKDEYWLKEARRAFAWYLGDNDLGVAMYDPVTCGCFDGLQPSCVNENQGAESTLAFLLSLVEMRRAVTRTAERSKAISNGARTADLSERTQIKRITVS